MLNPTLCNVGLLFTVLAQSICSAEHPWATSDKRGVGLPLGQPNQAANLLKLDQLSIPWFYSWAAEPLSGFAALPPGTSFVPMSWGSNSPQNHQSTWISGKQAGLYDTLLGFNEPDLATQANMTVEEALDLWPLLETTGLRLGSPAAANNNNSWMVDFMAGVADRGLRVDFLAVHRYGNADPQGFLNAIDSLYSQYNLPIWITEFAVRDGSASTPEENRWTDQQVYNFMADVLQGLESRSYVERYAWFHSPRDNAFVTSSALFENNGDLTKVGRLYIGQEEAIPDGGILLNPNFEDTPLIAPTYQASGADDWTTINDADRSTYYARTGRQSLSLAPGLPNGQAKPGIARQEFSVGVDVNINERYSLGAWVFHPSDDPLTGTREATLRIQWFDDSNNLLGDQRTLALDATSPTDEWIFVSLEDVLIPNDLNIAEIRATLWVNNVGPTSVNSGKVFFDDIVFQPSLSADLVGDFTGESVINGADYLDWARNLSANPFSSSDLSKWQSNFGSTVAQPLVTTIPEPHTLYIILQVILFCCFRHQSIHLCPGKSV